MISKSGMNKKERVRLALSHSEPDRVPKGEICIEAGIANRLLHSDYPDDYQHYERDRKIRELLKMDYINIGDWPTEFLGIDEQGYKHFRSVYGEEFIVAGKTKRVVHPPISSIREARSYRVPDIGKVSNELIRRFSEDNDFFIFAQIGGPVTVLDETFGMEDYLIYTVTNTVEMGILGDKIMEFETEKAKLFLYAGADAVLIGDDISYNSGPFLPPRIMEEIVFPFYQRTIREIKRYRDVPVLLHSDGNLMPVFDAIMACGFDGLHSLQPSAGMDIGEIKKRYGDVLCLIGNIDLDYVMTMSTPGEVEKVVKRTIDIAAPGGGYILSTCNALIDAIPDENALTMYRTADRYGLYR